MGIGISRAQGDFNKEHFKVVAESVMGVVKVSGAPALTISLS